MILLVGLPLVAIVAAVVLVVFSKRRAFEVSRNEALRSSPHTITIGVFRPYANGGGGGERVLCCALLALVQRFQKTDTKIQIALYAGNDELSTKELILRAADQFNLAELKTLHVDRYVTLVPLLSREPLEPSRYPSFTLLWLSVVHIRLALEAVRQSSRQQLYPQMWVDTTGCPFSYVVARLLSLCLHCCGLCALPDHFC